MFLCIFIYSFIPSYNLYTSAVTCKHKTAGLVVSDGWLNDSGVRAKFSVVYGLSNYGFLDTDINCIYTSIVLHEFISHVAQTKSTNQVHFTFASDLYTTLTISTFIIYSSICSRLKRSRLNISTWKARPSRTVRPNWFCILPLYRSRNYYFYYPIIDDLLAPKVPPRNTNQEAQRCLNNSAASTDFVSAPRAALAIMTCSDHGHI